nr:peptidyl-prolyl cis-trans isomerase-like 3 isoform X1 [Dermacentor andersoni]
MSVTLHTDLGDIKIELFCETCPKAAENFLALCASDYYNGCLFHRNIKGFMVQTGDPTDVALKKQGDICLSNSFGVVLHVASDKGTGKGGESIWGAKFADEIRDELKHSVRGVVSMANNGPNTNGSQFFITYAKQPHLDLKYTIFGKVIDGMDTLEELEKVPVNPKNYRPLRDIKLNSITIHANPFAQ